MADDRADPIMDNYDPDAEEHIMDIINAMFLMCRPNKMKKRISLLI